MTGKMTEAKIERNIEGKIEGMGSTSSMLRTGTITAAAVLSLTLAGCLEKEPPYEITGSASGTYLLNKETGEVQLIAGTRLLPVQAPSPAEGAAGNAKNWPAENPIGAPGTTVTVRTKYRDGQMLYEVTATPLDGVLKDVYEDRSREAAFILQMLDIDAFPVGEEIDLVLRRGTPVVNLEGVATKLLWTGSASMSEASYRALSSSQIGWRGFPRPTVN